MPHGGCAGTVLQDDPVYLLADDDEGFREARITGIRRGNAQCYRLTARNGVSIVVSDSTPITTRRGRILSVLECLGIDVPTLDHGVFGWSPIVAVDPVGVREVALISAGNGTYAAGEHRDRFMFTHNITAKP